MEKYAKISDTMKMDGQINCAVYCINYSPLMILYVHMTRFEKNDISKTGRPIRIILAMTFWLS